MSPQPPELSPSDVAWLLSQARQRWPREAEDICQAACLRAWAARDRYRAGNWRGWLLTILVNAGRDHGRRCRQRVERPVDPAEAPEPAAVVRRAAMPLAEDVGRVLALVAPVHREVLRLRLCGARYSEISERLGLPLGTVMSRLMRARHALVPHRQALMEELS
ncbi:MAG: RNA polymerase sigma factor [Lentisphaeria bacterium]